MLFKILYVAVLFSYNLIEFFKSAVTIGLDLRLWKMSCQSGTKPKTYPSIIISSSETGARQRNRSLLK